MNKGIFFIGGEEKVLYSSPDPQSIYCFTPALLRLDSGRLIATFDIGGPGVKDLSGVKAENGDFCSCSQGQTFVSDDRGKTWRHTNHFPMLHARPFVAGKIVYLIGQNGKLMICRSDDQGESWSAPFVLEEEHKWHQSACSIDYRHGRIYLTMEHIIPDSTWPGVAPVLMSADTNADLLRRENWQFSAPLVFADAVKTPVSPLGIPFYPVGETAPDSKISRFCGAPGWLESNVVRIYDPQHIFYDPADRTVMVFMRAHTGMTNIGAVVRGIENPDGSLRWETLTTPAGTPLVYVPLPGGQMKFHITYDPVSGYYWLLSSQATDSMTRPELLPDNRYGLPDNERHRLQLHFSKNLFDWCFAGMAAQGASPHESRHYASMMIDGDDLLILSRSGDHRAKSSHNGNLITFHKIKDFRNLLY